METNKWVASSQHLYRWLLHLYPKTYRTVYEAEMFHLFTDQCREAYKQRGRLGILFLWFRTLIDLGITVIREHLSDPRAKIGLLEAVPNEPLPWKGVFLVLVPGLIFFVSQVVQLTSITNLFFLVVFWAGYFLILPVLLVWLVACRFPVWGLIPLGLLYATLKSYYADRFELSNLPFVGYRVVYARLLFGVRISINDLKYLLPILICLVLLIVLIWRNARRGQIPRSVWIWLGLYGLLIILGAVGAVYSALGWWPPPEPKQYLFQVSLWYFYESLPFLLLVFIGHLFARKYGGFSFLLLWGYLLPTVLFGWYDTWYESVPFYVVSVTVLVYRFMVALVAPVWLARTASRPGRQRAVAVLAVSAILSHLSLKIITFVTHAQLSLNLLDLALDVWGQSIMAVGFGLALALYLPKEESQAVISPPSLIATSE